MSLPQSNNPLAQPTVTPEKVDIIPQVEQPQIVQSEKKDLDSVRFAQLSKKEQQIVRDREAFKLDLEKFKKDQDEWEKSKQPLLDGNSRLTQFDDLFKKDPIEAMKFAGFTEEHLMNFLASQEEKKASPEEIATKIAEDRIKKFEDAQLAEKEKGQKEQQEKAIQKFQGDIKEFMIADKEKYEYCNYYGEVAEELIFQTVEEVLNSTQEMMSIQEAADLVESYYEEQDKAMNSLKKRTPKPVEKQPEVEQKPIAVKADAAPEMSKTRVPATHYQENKKTPTKTITNHSGQTLSNTRPAHLSPEENKSRIIEKYRSYNR